MEQQDLVRRTTKISALAVGHEKIMYIWICEDESSVWGRCSHTSYLRRLSLDSHALVLPIRSKVLLVKIPLQQFNARVMN
mmetsp:Transcript_11719/g.21325  ORF Transcript_11719/g.21325 Transcript_11719/m.21325 type:complete len:80 (+) Transcript_11719:2448-2687(+)